MPKPKHPAKQKAFLAAYAKTGNISDAARLAKCDRSNHYHWMADPDYAEKFQAAQDNAVEDLESVARRRAKAGSDLLLMFLLKSLRPATYRDNFKGEIKVHTPQRVDYSKLTDEQLLTLRSLSALCYQSGVPGSGDPEAGEE